MRVSHWIIHDSFRNTDSFSYKSSDCLWEWVTESFMTHSETLINLVINQVAVYESESLNHSWLVQKHWLI